MNIRELQNRLDKIELAQTYGAVHLWEPTDDDVREAVTEKARLLGIPEVRIEVHTYRWIED